MERYCLEKPPEFRTRKTESDHGENLEIQKDPRGVKKIDDNQVREGGKVDP